MEAKNILLYSDDNGEIIAGKYRHYKGNEYEVLYVAKHSETLEPMVVYRALYGDFGVWVRPASMWNETVDVNGENRKRFEYLPPKHYNEGNADIIICKCE